MLRIQLKSIRCYLFPLENRKKVNNRYCPPVVVSVIIPRSQLFQTRTFHFEVFVGIEALRYEEATHRQLPKQVRPEGATFRMSTGRQFRQLE